MIAVAAFAAVLAAPAAGRALRRRVVDAREQAAWTRALTAQHQQHYRRAGAHIKVIRRRVRVEARRRAALPARTRVAPVGASIDR